MESEWRQLLFNVDQERQASRLTLLYASDTPRSFLCVCNSGQGREEQRLSALSNGRQRRLEFGAASSSRKHEGGLCKERQLGRAPVLGADASNKSGLRIAFRQPRESDER
jgi:hypothetical protein